MCPLSQPSILQEVAARVDEPSQASRPSGPGHPWRRYLWIGLLVVLLAGAIVVWPRGGGSPPTPDGPVAGTTSMPSFEQVQQLIDELYAAAVDNPDYPVDPADLPGVVTAPGPYTPLGRIRIPDVGLDAEFAAGVHPSVLEVGPGHWPGSAMPGQPGTAVLSGHRTTFTKPFAELEVLQPGDVLAIAYPDRPEITFRVVETAIVPEAEYQEFVLRPPVDPQIRQLTLFACHPEGDRTHRIVVRAQAEEGA